MSTTKISDTEIREMIEKALDFYDMPEVCINIALAYIDGLKMGAAQYTTLEPEPQEQVL
ncbi:MAG: hypothetical protein J1F64_07180 [Oscillospiraceae bacterium]|nr:hypothetical protein [Oscillospiraceae bacterium]